MSRFIVTQKILDKIMELESKLNALEEQKEIELNPTTYEPVVSVDYLTKRTVLESQIKILNEVVS